MNIPPPDSNTMPDDMSEEVVIVAPPPYSSPPDFSNVTWENLDSSPTGLPIGYQQKLWNEYRSIELRSICSRLFVRGIKNSKKAEMIESIITTYNNKNNYTLLKKPTTFNNSPRKEIQCTYRLINILFSDLFATEFSNIGNSATRAVLDAGKCGNDELFWKKIVVAFSEILNDDYALLMFVDNEVFINEVINPGKVVDHNWKKLRTIWKTVNSEYKQALARYSQSGTHTDNFYSFCNGKKDVYYLRLWLEIKPNLNDMVVADLPDACNVTSAATLTSSDDNGNNKPVSAEKLKRKHNNELIIEAIKESGYNKINEDLANNKILYMKEQGERNKEELKMKGRVMLFKEWERVRFMIKNLRTELKAIYNNNNNNNDDDQLMEINEVKDDIKGLMNRKAELGELLGLNV
jgi:hypothetical protein